jgi:hypothetical protein
MWSLFRVWEKTFDMIFRSLIRFDSEQTKILSPAPPHPPCGGGSSSQHAGHALSEGTARAAQLAHLQRSLPAQSEDLRQQKCGWPSLSDDEELVEEPVTARRWTSSPPA